MFMSPQLRSQVRNVANSYEPGPSVAFGPPVTAPIQLTQTQELPKIPRVAHIQTINTLIPNKRRSVRVTQRKTTTSTREYTRGLLKTKVYVHRHELQAIID